MTIRSPTPPGRPDGVRIRIVEGGFPHSEILGSKLVRSSPRLIAAYHVLHRLSAPRHPPNALKTLDHSHDRCPPPGSENPGDRRLIRKTIGSNLSARALACRTHPVKDAVTSSLVAETRKFGYRACSLFTISKIRAPPRDEATHELLQDFRTAHPRAKLLVEPDGIEPTTSCLQSTRSPN